MGLAQNSCAPLQACHLPSTVSIHQLQTLSGISLFKIFYNPIFTPCNIPREVGSRVEEWAGAGLKVPILNPKFGLSDH